MRVEVEAVGTWEHLSSGSRMVMLVLVREDGERLDLRLPADQEDLLREFIGVSEEDDVTESLPQPKERGEAVSPVRAVRSYVPIEDDDDVMSI